MVGARGGPEGLPGGLVPPRRLGAGERSRQLLLRLIREHPGIHPRLLCRASGLGWGTVNHHLGMLERMGLVRIRPGRPSRVFAAEVPAAHERGLVRLHDATDLRILALLRHQPGADVPSLGRGLQVARRTLERHLAGLVQAGLVSRSGTYRSRFYPDEAALAAWLASGPAPAGPEAGSPSASSSASPGPGR
jgi:DNA-binding MarR family transcriptional regulator